MALGFGIKTQLHAVSDGAFWIMDQVTTKFGAQASYLVDFYHVCEYLAAASKTCEPNNHRAWAKQQEDLLKQNEFESVIKNLAAHLETDDVENHKASVRACHR